MPTLEVEDLMRRDPAGARLPHDERYERGAAFVNGQFCPTAEAFVPMSDMGFTQSDGVYDKATVVKGQYFRLQDHLDRFASSCEKFRLRNPYPAARMVEIFDELIRLTGFRNAGVFWCVTRGLARPGVRDDRANPDAFENRFYAKVDPYGSLATPDQRQRGLDLMISRRYIRIPAAAVDPTAKNFHWQDMKLSLFEAREDGKDWSVLTDADGYLTEVPGANIFAVKDGELLTPGSGCLEGITRRTAIELAELVGVRTQIRPVHARELLAADDAFVTSSAGGIMPVNSVDGVVLGGVEGPGELATRLHDLYWEKLWAGWNCTAVNYGATIPAL